MKRIEQTARGWRLTIGNMGLDLDATSGDLSRLVITAEREFLWTEHRGGIAVRDDLLGHTFRAADLQRVDFEHKDDELILRKTYRGAPWRLTERYRLEEDALYWTAAIAMDNGDFRSCAISMNIPWPQPLYPMQFWAAKDNMPSAPHRFAGIALEYGEITSGIIIPAICAYLEEKKAGLMLAMPFDFRTARFGFHSGYRDLDLEVRFDWLALAPARAAQASLILRGTGGHWRPALGWLYERFKGYFEPRSELIPKLWGGHISGGCNVSRDEARVMAELGMKWHEIHQHFPAYGNYHPEGMASWRSGHARDDSALITVEMIRQTIANLHAEGIAALPYIQVSGDGDTKLIDPAFAGARIRDCYGDEVSAWPETFLMNSDPQLPFGKDMVRQIKGMVERYPQMDGVFLDQPCYNFLDTAHDDGITAVGNRPAYMTGFNYYPHLELLSALLHPGKVIIANAPFGVGILKYIDAFMAEGQGWLCDHLQYYGLAKPLFFLVYNKTDRDLEEMFRSCIVHGAGYTSYPWARPSKDLYDLYRPVLEMLFGRRWVFDAAPLQLPAGFKGNLFSGPAGNLLASIVSSGARYPGRTIPAQTVCVQAKGAERVAKITLHDVGKEPVVLPFSKDGQALQFDIPGDTIAAVAKFI